MQGFCHSQDSRCQCCPKFKIWQDCENVGVRGDGEWTQTDWNNQHWAWKCEVSSWTQASSQCGKKLWVSPAFVFAFGDLNNFSYHRVHLFIMNFVISLFWILLMKQLVTLAPFLQTLSLCPVTHIHFSSSAGSPRPGGGLQWCWHFSVCDPASVYWESVWHHEGQDKEWCHGDIPHQGWTFLFVLHYYYLLAFSPHFFFNHTHWKNSTHLCCMLDPHRFATRTDWPFVPCDLWAKCLHGVV